jgi:hypothetical protein
MKTATVLTSGLAGVAAAIAIRETIRNNYYNGPRLDVFKRALSKLADRSCGIIPSSKKQFSYTLVEDLLNLTLYYSLSGLQKHKHVFVKGAVAGFAAGVGVVVLPKLLGYNEEYDKKEMSTNAITIGLNTVGGILAASIIHFVNAKSEVVSKSGKRSAYPANQVLGFDEY